MCVEMVQNCFQRRDFLQTVLDTSIPQSINPLIMKKSYKLPLAQMLFLSFHFCHAVQATPPTRTCGVFVSYKRVRSFFIKQDKLTLSSC